MKERKPVRAPRWMLLVGLLAPLAWSPPAARAHDARPAYLQIDAETAQRYQLLWRRPVLAGMPLAVALRLPDDARTLGQPTVQESQGALTERRTIELPGGLAGRRIDFVGLETTITDVLVRVQRIDGASTTALVSGSRPWLEIQPPRGALATGAVYVRHGIEHILLGYDHLLFVLALCLLVRSRRVLLATITAFTVAHSITLAFAALGAVCVPIQPVEASIAFSIVLLAREVLGTQRGRDNLTVRRPWVVAFCFGLLHGFGFASALVEVGLPPGDVPLALFSFNVGVELGQLAFVSVVLALYQLALRVRLPAGARSFVRPATAWAIGALASFWFFERLGAFVP